MNEIISLNDYAMSGIGGFGESSQAEMQTLQKALTAGEITGRDNENLGATGGSVLKVESLENVLKVLTFKETDIVFWNKIPKLPAYNTVEEYNQLIDYGSIGGSFNNEGELPEEDDATYARKSQLVKFMGTTRTVSHPMQLVNLMQGVGNAVQSQVTAGTLKILRDVDFALSFGDSKMVKQQFNGIYAQHKDPYNSISEYYNADVVIDLKGKALSDKDVQAASLAIIENNGSGNLLMGPPSVLSDYVTRFHANKRVNVGQSGAVSGAEMGQEVTSIQTQFGKVELGYDKFMSVNRAFTPKTSVSTANNPKAPVAPSVSAAAVAGNGEKFSGFTGDYIYAVTAVNRFGESAPAFTSAVTVGANQSIDLTVTAGTGGAYQPSQYNVYKTVLNKVTGAVKAYYLFSVAVADLAIGYDGATSGKIKDKNHNIPNTESALLIDHTIDVYSFKQLAPLMKMDLAQVGPATRFMILLYGTPVVYAPKKIVKFVNIGSELI